jgi:hypothetical protein
MSGSYKLLKVPSVKPSDEAVGVGEHAAANGQQKDSLSEGVILLKVTYGD